jgi:hypothetical protein
MTDKETLDALCDLVLGPPLTCSCGEEEGHFYDIQHDRLMHICIDDDSLAPRHTIMLNGNPIITLGVITGSYTTWDYRYSGGLKIR